MLALYFVRDLYLETRSILQIRHLILELASMLAPLFLHSNLDAETSYSFLSLCLLAVLYNPMSCDSLTQSKLEHIKTSMAGLLTACPLI